MTAVNAIPSFGVVYDPELAQYVVERGEMRVVPTRPCWNGKAPSADCEERARALCETLNQLYAET